MPLLVLTGYPSSGKSTVTELVAEHIKSRNEAAVVTIVTDTLTSRNFHRAIYASSSKEKDQRGLLRSAVQKALTKDTVVICDSLNYIKGFRYELFCIAKLVKTTYAVVHCAADVDTCKRWNATKPDDQSYPEEILDALVSRYERPEAKNRWDSPLICTDDNSDHQHLLDSVYMALFQAESLPPNLSTESTPLASTNFLYELDRITSEIVHAIIDQQNGAFIGEQLTVAGTTHKVLLKRHWTLPALSRLRRQYIAYTKVHMVESAEKIPQSFVCFLNNAQ